MIEKAFDDWAQFKSEFIHYLPGNVEKNTAYAKFLYRGQKNENWGIVSSFDRRRNSPENAEDKRIQQIEFCDYLMRYLGTTTESLNDFEKAARAQHYGVPTRLIDWTMSPYVSAFFAFFDAIIDDEVDKNSRVAIFALHIPTFETNSSSPIQFALRNSPNPQNHRQRNQRGKFTEALGSEVDFADFVQKTVQLERSLAKWTIPITEAAIALNDLILMGISPVDIYPDFEGAANYIKLRDKLEHF